MLYKIILCHWYFFGTKSEEFEAKFEIPEDPIPVKSEPLEDICLISISHDDYTIIQEQGINRR